jgi:ATP-dependent Clp protease ATP-binding subunit ClpC
VDLEIKKVVERVKTKDITLDLAAEAKDFLITKGYDPTYGARPMRRAVERYIEDPMAEEVLRGNIKAGDTVTVQLNGEKLDFVIVHSKEEPKAEVAAT